MHNYTKTNYTLTVEMNSKHTHSNLWGPACVSSQVTVIGHRDIKNACTESPIRQILMILYKKDGRNRLSLPVLWREEWRVAAFPTEPKDTANDMSLANKQTFFIVCPTQTGTEIHKIMFTEVTNQASQRSRLLLVIRRSAGLRHFALDCLWMLPTYNVSNRNMKLKSIISFINYSAVTVDAALIKDDQLVFFKGSSLKKQIFAKPWTEGRHRGQV